MATLKAQLSGTHVFVSQGPSSRGTTPRSSHVSETQKGPMDGFESSIGRDAEVSWGCEVRIIQTLVKEMGSLLVQMTVPALHTVGSTLAVPLFYTNVNNSGSAPTLQHSASTPPNGQAAGGLSSAKSNSLEVTAQVEFPVVVLGDQSHTKGNRLNSVTFGTELASPDPGVTPDSGQATPMATSLNAGGTGGKAAVQQICQNTLLAVRRAMTTALDDLERMVGEMSPTKNGSTFLTPNPAHRPLDMFLQDCLPKAFRGSRDSILGARFLLRPTSAEGTQSPTSQGATRNFSGQGFTQFQAFGYSTTTAIPEYDHAHAGVSEDAGASDVSNWLKETYSSETGTRRLRQSKNESTTKRSVTRMASNASRASAVDSTNTGLVSFASSSEKLTSLTPRASPQDGAFGANPNSSATKMSIGSGFSKAAAEAHDAAAKRHRQPSTIAFKGEEVVSDDKDESEEGDSLTAHPAGGRNAMDHHHQPAQHSADDDPFANVKPLSSESINASNGDDDGSHNPPSLSAKPLMRRSSQYFRRQSAVLAPDALFAANSNASGGQTLNTEDVIQMRLTALNVPWLDVDSPDFDIFEAAEQIDSGRIDLTSRRPSRGDGSSSNPSSPTTASLNGSLSSDASLKLSSDHIFIYVCLNVMLRYSFIDALKVDLKKLYAFLGAVESLYRSENSYHNSVHAADVLQTSHIYLMNNDVYENFFDREILCLFLAALAHDVGHLGINNQFLIKSHHPLAVLYNNLSPLENMHSLIVFRLLEKDELNFLRDSDVWSSEDYAALTEKVVEMVIATDMKFHGAVVTLANDMFKEGFSVGDSDVEKLIKMIIHCADLSNPMKSQRVYVKWLERVVAEFFTQGEAERSRGMTISPNFDRHTGRIPEMQVGFITFVVRPYAKAMAAILPPQWLERMDANLSFMQSICGKTYEFQDRVLEMCKEPWVDTFDKVRHFMESAAVLSASRSSSVVAMDHEVADKMCETDLLWGCGPIVAASAALLPPLASARLPHSNNSGNSVQQQQSQSSASPVESRVSSFSSKRPGSSSMLVSPAVSMISEAQTRFAVTLMDFTKKCVAKLVSDFADGQLQSKMVQGEHQRSFATGMVRHISKSLETLVAVKELNAGKRSAEEFVENTKKRLRHLLTGYRAPTDAEILALPQNSSLCVELMKNNWATLQADENFTRYTPRDVQDKPPIFADVVRLAYQTFQSIFSGLSTTAIQIAVASVSGSLLSVDTVPARDDFSAHDTSLGLMMLPGPLFRPNGSGTLLQQLTGAAGLRPGDSSVSRSQPLHPLSGVTRAQPAHVQQPTEPIPINGRYSAPLTKGTPGLPPIPVVDHQRLPPIAFGYAPQPVIGPNGTPHYPLRVSTESAVQTTHDLLIQESLRADDEDEPLEDRPQVTAALEEIERQAQLHFQQSEEQWRMTQDGDASPRSLGGASVGSFRNLRGAGAMAVLPGASRQSSPNASPHGGRVRGPPVTQQQQAFQQSSPNRPAEVVPESPPMIGLQNDDRPPSAFSNPSRDTRESHSVADHPFSGVTVPGIPDAYFLHPQGHHQQQYRGNQQEMGQIEGFSFIPMVHSLDPSPRRVNGVHSPGTAPLDLSTQIGNAETTMDAHNLLQLETFLAHHAALGHAVANAYSNANSAAGSPLSGSLPLNAAMLARQPLGSRLRGPNQTSNRSASPEQLASAIDDNDLHPAGASLTSLSHPTAVSPSHVTQPSAVPVPLSPTHSPKRRRNRNAPNGGTTPVVPTGEESPLNNPLYRQQLAEMVVNGIENHTFGSRQGSMRVNGSPVPTAVAAPGPSNSPLPSVTPQQQQEIEEGCLVPEVYRASSMRSNVSSFRRQPQPHEAPLS